MDHRSKYKTENYKTSEEKTQEKISVILGYTNISYNTKKMNVSLSS